MTERWSIALPYVVREVQRWLLYLSNMLDK